MKKVYLNQFQSIAPKNCVAQEDLLIWITKAHQLAELSKSEDSQIDNEVIKRLFQRYAVKSSQISQRYVESDDILSDDFKNHEIYRLDDLHTNGIDITKRADFFSKRSYEVFKKIYNLETKTTRPDHLIHVTCTGYISPSAAQKIVSEPNWNQTTEITHAYHMGCYASLPAIRLAKNIIVSESLSNDLFQTDIVHNEMCGLHMNTLSQTPEQMIVQTLFADGHVKYSVSTKLSEAGKNLAVISILEKIIPDSSKDMSWISAPFGMQMNLSREVPAKIKPELNQFMQELFVKAKIDLCEKDNCLFAIHPGGPKIIESTQEALSLSNEQIKESKKILFERGNMSSATLPHIWNEILENNYPTGTRVVSFAFGPGLTIFGAVFEIC